MQFVKNTSEDEMVALFLRTEIRAPRYAAHLLRLLEEDGAGRAIVDDPDTSNPGDNAYRFALFTRFRGYGDRQGYFQDFPRDVSWQRVVLSPDELLRARYIDYDYWVELSGRSRQAPDAARNIRAGRTVFGVTNDSFLALADALRDDAVFPELILVWASEGSHLVVLEGHARLTAYALFRDKIPPRLPIFLGTSADMASWGLY